MSGLVDPRPLQDDVERRPCKVDGVDLDTRRVKIQEGVDADDLRGARPRLEVDCNDLPGAEGE